MKEATLILTDSGGVQEEGPSLGKPVLVMRTTTERPEAVEAGTVRLVGVKHDDIFRNAQELLDDEAAYGRMANAVNPYGDGHAAKRHVEAIRYFLGLTSDKPSDEFNPERQMAVS
ncbi:UDP-N-acetylglucosamine 2-epimerase [compost metagenome]